MSLIAAGFADFRPLKGQGQLVVLDGVAGLAALLFLEQHIGVLVMEERDRWQLKLPEGGHGIDFYQVRPPRLGGLHRLLLTLGLDADE